MNIIFYLIVFVFGLIVGSFLNCVIYRLALTPKLKTSGSDGLALTPKFGSDGLKIGSRSARSFLKGRSFCPHCKHTLRCRDLIPIFSFLILKGKCRYCQQKISFQYPIVELATGLLFVLIVNYRLFPKIEMLSNLTIVELFDVCFLFFVFCSLIVIFVYDLKHFIIPDKVIFSAIIIALIYNLFQLFTTHYPLSTVLNNLYAAFGAAIFFLAIVLVSRGKWMGLGDVKLAFFMGLLLGFPNILVALFLAFLIGAIIGVGLILAKRKHLKSELPFGPFLVTGTFIALFWGQAIAYWYLNLFHLNF